MNKERYYIGISGEDGYYTERSLTKKEAELVQGIIDELQTNREGCWMYKLPSEKEIQNILKEYQTWKKNPEIPQIIKFNKFILEDQLWQRFAYDILSKEKKIAYEIQGYIRQEIGKLIDLYEKLH